MKVSFLILCLNSSDGHDTFVLLILKETLFNTIKIRSFVMYFLVEKLCHICLTPKFLVAVCPFPSIQDATVIPHLMALLSRSRYTQEYICQIFSHCCKVRTRVNVLAVNLCVFLYQRADCWSLTHTWFAFWLWLLYLGVSVLFDISALNRFYWLQHTVCLFPYWAL